MKKIQMILAVTLCSAVTALAQLPDVINFQGRLINGTNLYNGSVGLELRLFKQPTGGGAECIDSNVVDVVDGLYSTYLGDNITWGSLDMALGSTSLWLEVVVDGEVLSPREQVVSVAYARLAAGVPSGAIQSHMIASGQIYGYHMTDGAVTAAKIDDGAVTSNHLAEGAVTFDSLQRGYEAGSLDIVPNSYGFYTNIVQSFASAFNTTPIVTMNLSFDMAITNLRSSIHILQRSATGFSAQVQVDPYDMPINTSSNLTTWGWYPSLKMVSGNPACAYVNASGAAHDLCYRRSSDAMGMSWGAVVVVHTNGTVGRAPSMALVNGNPAIAFCDTDSGTLYYRRSSGATGYTGWDALETIDTTGDAGEYASLTMIQGRPAISYYRAADSNLMFIRANDADGTSWTAGNAATVVTEVDMASSTTLLDVDGSPAICYYDAGNDDLMFVRAADAYGSNWWPAVTVASDDDAGYYASMAIVDGRPAISYRDATATTTNLMYVRASNAQGSGWGSPVMVDTNNGSGYYTSLCVIQGYPAIAYSRYGDDGGAFYVRATDVDGTTWNAPSRLYATTGLVGHGAALEEVNGAAGIMFTTWTFQLMNYVTVTNINASIDWMAIEP
jgi:hypothetical protein